MFIKWPDYQFKILHQNFKQQNTRGPPKCVCDKKGKIEIRQNQPN